MKNIVAWLGTLCMFYLVIVPIGLALRLTAPRKRATESFWAPYEGYISEGPTSWTRTTLHQFYRARRGLLFAVAFRAAMASEWLSSEPTARSVRLAKKVRNQLSPFIYDQY